MEKFSNVYVSDCHRKYYLKVHLIFVCKYRKKLLNDIVSGHLKGWVRGTLNRPTIGRIKINNGIVEKLIDPNDWIKGKKKRSPK